MANVLTTNANAIVVTVGTSVRLLDALEWVQIAVATVYALALHRHAVATKDGKALVVTFQIVQVYQIVTTKVHVMDLLILRVVLTAPIKRWDQRVSCLVSMAKRTRQTAQSVNAVHATKDLHVMLNVQDMEHATTLSVLAMLVGREMCVNL